MTINLPNIIKYKSINIYGTLAGIYLAILANTIANIHINFSWVINLHLLAKFITILSIACILQYLYLNISPIKEISDREFGSYLKECDNKKIEPAKRIENYFDDIIKSKPRIRYSPYIAIILIIVHIFIN